MTTIFDEVHGFNLKLPYNRNYPSSNNSYGEWIEITKNPNELPTVKLRTIVLYYRNDGTNTIYNSGNNSNNNIPTSVTSGTVDGGNYRFYNKSVSSNGTAANGRQLGWIWGFPLFDVGRDSTNWPRFHSCIGSDRAGFSGSDICGNETMLVDISAKKNIIILNFEGLGSTIFDQIKNNIPGITDAFFMTLRIKSSTESDFFNSVNSANGSGHDGCWNLYSNGTLQKKKWASLIQYEYECDIIGPKAMLDFTLNYFMYNNGGTGTIINTGNTTSKELLQLDSAQGNNSVNTVSEFRIRIITGLGVQNNAQYRMDIKNILTNLSSANYNNTHRFLQIPSRSIINQNGNDGITVVKLIGGWYNRGWAGSSGGISDETAIGYYGDYFGTGNRQTKMTNNNSTHKTQGWKRFIELEANPTTNPNQWIDNISTSNYEFNNILWCSLRSPRKIPITRRGVNNNSFDLHRFITNFIDLSGGNTSNKIIGGGYGRYTNTIDMPRQSINPYYSSVVTENSNTVSITNFNLNEDENYLDASNVVLSLNDLNYFTVYYKLLVPLNTGETFNIEYTFGRNSNCVTTFVRHNDMSGNPTPSGTSNLSAVRDEESITLTWDDNSMDGSGNMPIQAISFTDVASGFKKVDASFNITETILDNAMVNDKLEYDISFNVFQFNFLATLGNTTLSQREEIPYTVQTFDTNTPNPQIIDISYIPYHYEPYRYINYKQEGVNNLEQIFFPKSEYSVAPMITIEENLELKLAKYYARNGNNLGGLTSTPSLVDPSGTKFIPNAPPQDIIDVDVSSNIYDNSFSLIRAILPESAITTNEINKEEIIILAITSDGNPFFTNKQQNEQRIVVNKFVQFYQPNTLDLSTNLIPDYWRLPDKINSLRKTNSTGISPTYTYFDEWQNQIQIAMVLDILSVSLKFETAGVPQTTIEYLLVNTMENSNQYSAMSSIGETIDNTTNNLIFEVQGWRGLTNGQFLNQKPIIVQLFTTTSGPFGPSAKAFIGNKNGSGTSGVPPASADKGINVPYPAQPQVGLQGNESNYIVNEFLPGSMRKGNAGGGANLGINENSYNGEFDINLSSWDDGGSNIQNPSFNGTSISPSPLKCLLVDLPNVTQTNADPTQMINDANNAITINWTSFFFSSDSTWNYENSNVFWTISRVNIATGISNTVLDNEVLSLNSNNEYTFTDTDIRVYDKLRYSVTGVFKWIELTNIATNNVPSILIPGFTTPDCFACKFNRFEYGRFNTTSTNLKLFRPLLINTPEGQVNQFGDKTCGGGCRDPNNPELNLYATGSRISSSNNIYANTTNQVSKKETYVILAKSRFRPFR